MDIVFITTSQPQERGTDASPPLALSLQGVTDAAGKDTGETCMEKWWSLLRGCGLDGADAAASTYLATNALYYKYFEYEAFGRGVPLAHIVNSGRSLGDNRVDWSTIALTLRLAAKRGAGARAALLIGADAVSPPDLDAAALGALLAQARESGRSAVFVQPGALVGEGGPVSAAVLPPAGAAGVARVTLSTGGGAEAAGAAAAPGERIAAAPALYYLTAADIAMLLAPEGEAAVRAAAAAAAAAAAPAAAAPGASTLGEPTVPVEAALHVLAGAGRVQAVPLPTPFSHGALNGSRHGLTPSAAAAGPYVHALPRALGAARVTYAHYARGYARVGLLGNPSDGYGGKTLAVTIENFYAEAWLGALPPTVPCASSIFLLPHPVYDPLRYPSLPALSTISKREGYSGGLRLMAATLHRLHALCEAKGVPLDRSRGFVARYHTTVPRQVGLAGSSAIITAFLKAAMSFYGIAAEPALSALGLTKDLLPAFVLAIESEELGITAGLQDRVVQSYESAVHMDFSPALIAAQGHGAYTRIPCAALPPLFLAYAADPSDSGRIHAPIKQRWLAGDEGVIAAMRGIAELADEGLALAQRCPYSAAPAPAACAGEWAALFARNFNARRALFGDGALGKDNIRMVEIARECGASAKFPGSGGAVVGVVDVEGMAAAGRVGAGAGVEAATAALRAAYHAEGYVFVRLAPQESAP